MRPSGAWPGGTLAAPTSRSPRTARRPRPPWPGAGRAEIQAAFTSPAQRAVRTAELAGLPAAKPDPDLWEWDYGGYEAAPPPRNPGPSGRAGTSGGTVSSPATPRIQARASPRSGPGPTRSSRAGCGRCLPSRTATWCWWRRTPPARAHRSLARPRAGRRAAVPAGYRHPQHAVHRARSSRSSPAGTSRSARRRLPVSRPGRMDWPARLRSGQPASSSCAGPAAPLRPAAPLDRRFRSAGRLRSSQARRAVRPATARRHRAGVGLVALGDEPRRPPRRLPHYVARDQPAGGARGLEVEPHHTSVGGPTDPESRAAHRTAGSSPP